MDCGAMARDGKGVGRRRDARNEILQICISKARTCGECVAGTDCEHVTACPIMLFVDRVAKGFPGLNDAAFDAGRATGSPVRGLRP